MEYVPFNNISKRNIDQTISNENESFIVFNKRTCTTEEVKFHLKDSRQNLKLHVNPEWNCINKDFEHATNRESMKLHRTNGVPIIFHFASEEIMDLENYGSDNLVTELTSIHSAVSVPIPRKKSSQLDQNRDHRMITEHVCEDRENDPSYQLEFNPILAPSSLLSISDTSLDRSLERLQANYREHLVRRKKGIKSSIYQPSNETIDAPAYVRCRKHRQLIPVQIIASDSEGKMCEFIQPNSLSQMRPNNSLSEICRRKYKQHRRKSFISDLP